MGIIDEQQVKQDWQNRGFSFDVWIDQPEQEWNDFVHKTDELLMLVDGELELIIEGQYVYPQIGEEILIPTNAKHSVKTMGNKRSRWLYGFRDFYL